MVVRDTLAEEVMYNLSCLMNGKWKMLGMGNCRCKDLDGGKILEGLWYRKASVAAFSRRGRDDTRSERQPGAVGSLAFCNTEHSTQGRYLMSI